MVFLNTNLSIATSLVSLLQPLLNIGVYLQGLSPSFLISIRKSNIFIAILLRKLIYSNYMKKVVRYFRELRFN